MAVLGAILPKGNVTFRNGLKSCLWKQSSSNRPKSNQIKELISYFVKEKQTTHPAGLTFTIDKIK
jgi:hypothetical protein